MEEFRIIKDYENYEVSNFGNVRNIKTGRVLKGVNSKGYLRVNLNNGVRKTLRIHRLVGIAFIPNPKNKECLDHIDNNQLNNHISNLRWANLREN